MKWLIGIVLIGCYISVTIETAADDFLYYDLEFTLKSCLKQGRVDYELLDQNKHILYKFLNDVASVPEKRYKQWSRNEKLAFWINLYNVFSLSLHLKNPYASHIKEIRERPSMKVFTVFGKKISLNEIKHTYIRGMFNDERIHFAVVGPARGFPRFRDEAYLGRYINLQLEEDVFRFVTDEQNVKIDQENKKIYLSKLFKWFGVDFVHRYSTDNEELMKFNVRERAVLNFLSSYLPKRRDFILSGRYTIEYPEFDWTLNRIEKTDEE